MIWQLLEDIKKIKCITFVFNRHLSKDMFTTKITFILIEPKVNKIN